MEPDRITRLTEMQRKCLRLVYAHLSSKEIAPRLGVEPGTVDQYIKAAMRTLGVSDRRKAARMLAEQEGAVAQPLVYQPPDIARGHEPEKLTPSIGERPETALGEAMREEPVPFQVTAPSAARLRLPFAAKGGTRNDLGSGQRLAWIAAIAILGALAYFGLIEGAGKIAEVVRGLRTTP
ncbi:helix-turn-helix transcriptional regulator [Sphingosinicella sp. LHD-64]|uniref:helix-turn-helix domain-containing protein n=1 Tax=Sphingosinicella sp. LHD-64 TaxID=3072139 RepID=UPI00280E5D49|nr:helix-turn-helix transcriptional regulator [Sphingosinicella sp. LHD-64]MDQ8756446.1 helix-turn-helix transcriptional regulator [Sphingosinicella sp. LHD-64]